MMMKFVAAAEKVHPFGDTWVTKLSQEFFALDEDRKYLSNIVTQLICEAERTLEGEQRKREQEEGRW